MPRRIMRVWENFAGSTACGSLLILVAATAIRLGWVFHLIANQPDSLLQGPLHAAEMGNIATNLAEGRGFSFPFGSGSQPTAWECPLVPAVFAGVIRIAGGSQRSVIAMIFYLQSLVGGLAACLQWLVIRRLMDRSSGAFSKWLSPAVAIMVCLWPEGIYSATEPWYFVWQDAALALFVLLSLQWWEERGDWRAAAVGLCGGIVGLINITPLPVVLGAILILVVRSRFRFSGFRSTGIAAVCFAVVIAPWVARNGLVFGTPMALRSNTGFELFQGNNAIECIRQPDNAPHPANDKRELKMYLQMREISYCRYSLHRAVAYVSTHPVQTLRRIADRIYVSWLTDLTDHWVPASQRPWWTAPWRVAARHAAMAALNLTAFAAFLWGLLAGRFRWLPQRFMFVLMFVFLPLPHYVTLADAEYTAGVRLWMSMVALCMVALRRWNAGSAGVGAAS